MKKILAIVMLFSVIRLAAQPEMQVVQITSPLKTKVTEMIEKATSDGLPGIIVSVRADGMEYDLASGYSNLEKRIPMTTGDRVMVASITKMFMGVVTWQLAEKGVIDLHKPLAHYPWAAELGNVPNTGVITIAHLLNHTSGLPDFVKHPAFFLNVLDRPAFDWDQKQLLRFLEKEKPAFTPGSAAAYSNSNFLLLAWILDKELGKQTDHVGLINEKLIAHLQLQHTVYSKRKEVPSFTARGYAELYNDGRIINVSHFNSGGSGNGYSGLYSNAGDLHNFISALFNNRTLLADSTLTKMMSFVSDSEEKDIWFGSGFWKEFANYGADNYAIGHRGRDIAYTTELWWFPEKKMSVVILVNCGAVMDSRLTQTYKNFRKEFFETLLVTQ